MGLSWICLFLLGLQLLESIAGIEPGCVLTENGRTRQHKVLVFVDGEYFSLFHNWVLHFNRTCDGQLSNLELACMDDVVADKLPGLNMSLGCSASYHDILNSTHPSISDRVGTVGNRVSGVWLKRFQIVIRLLEAQHDVILSDTDALWLQNPYPTLSQYATTSGIVSSRGWFPRPLAKVWGTTICMGFIYLRSNLATLSFLQLVFDDMRSTQQTFRAYWEWMASTKQNSSALSSPLPFSNSSHSGVESNVHRNSSCTVAREAQEEEERDEEQQDGEEVDCASSTDSPALARSGAEGGGGRVRGLPFNRSHFSLDENPLPSTKEDWQHIDVREADDQYSINMVLKRLQVVFPADMSVTYKTHAHTARIFISDNFSSSFSSPSFSLNITLLPENQFVRNCIGETVAKLERAPIPSKKIIATVHDRTEQAIIAHCLLAPGNSVIKEHYMVLYGLWLLPGEEARSFEILKLDARKKLIEKMERTRKNTAKRRQKLSSRQQSIQNQRWMKTNDLILASQMTLWERAADRPRTGNATVLRGEARRQKSGERRGYEMMEMGKRAKIEEQREGKRREEGKGRHEGRAAGGRGGPIAFFWGGT